MVADHPAATDDAVLGRDVADGATLLSGAELGAPVLAAYAESETQRREELSEFLTAHAVPHALITGSDGIRAGLIWLTGVLERAG
jgi:hypothetical protein